MGRKISQKNNTQLLTYIHVYFYINDDQLGVVANQMNGAQQGVVKMFADYSADSGENRVNERIYTYVGNSILFMESNIISGDHGD